MAKYGLAGSLISRADTVYNGYLRQSTICNIDAHVARTVCPWLVLPTILHYRLGNAKLKAVGTIEHVCRAKSKRYVAGLCHVSIPGRLIVTLDNQFFTGTL